MRDPSLGWTDLQLSATIQPCFWKFVQQSFWFDLIFSFEFWVDQTSTFNSFTITASVFSGKYCFSPTLIFYKYNSSTFLSCKLSIFSPTFSLGEEFSSFTCSQFITPLKHTVCDSQLTVQEQEGQHSIVTNLFRLLWDVELVSGFFLWDFGVNYFDSKVGCITACNDLDFHPHGC